MNRLANYRKSAKSRVHDTKKWNSVFTARFIFDTFLTHFVRMTKLKQTSLKRQNCHFRVSRFCFGWSFGLIDPSGLCISGHVIRASLWASLIRQRKVLGRFTFMANVNLCHVTKFSLYLSFTVLSFYKNRSSFTSFSSIRIVLDCFCLIICYFQKFSIWTCRLHFAVNATLNLSTEQEDL